MREHPIDPFNILPGSHIYTVTKPASDPNRNLLTMDASTSGFLFGTVTITVRYDLGAGCMSATKSITMQVTPASLTFRGSATAIPSVCYSDSQNIGDYTTDAGFTNYSWSASSVLNVGTGTATSTTQSTNMNWISSGTGIGGLIPITATYFKSGLNCTNTNLARNGVNIRKPTLAGPNLPQVFVGQSVLFSSANSDGYEWSWAISTPSTPPNFGQFVTDNTGITVTIPTGSTTWIRWDRNNEPDPFPTVSVNYWLYYPQVSGTRISYCTGASKQIDIRACNGCSSRKASDVAFDSGDDESGFESGAFQAYPTIADTELWLRNVPLGASIRMISINGAEVVNTIQNEESLLKKVATGDLNSGVYVLRTIDIDNQPISLRVIVRH